MGTREDDSATVTLAATELQYPTMAWSVDDVHDEIMVFKIFYNVIRIYRYSRLQTVYVHLAITRQRM